MKGYDATSTASSVDGDPVPVPHFGLALSVDEFHELAARVGKSDIKFELEPHLRFKGQPGEQWTMFFRDPSGNVLEFKAMTKPVSEERERERRRGREEEEGEREDERKKKREEAHFVSSFNSTLFPFKKNRKTSLRGTR